MQTCFPYVIIITINSSPENIIITDARTINKIQNDNNFKKCIDEIIKKYGNRSQFNTGNCNESLVFEDGDLFFALHNTYINVIGELQKNGKWNLDIILSDKYDFTDFKEINKYVKKDELLKAFVG